MLSVRSRREIKKAIYASSYLPQVNTVLPTDAQKRRPSLQLVRQTLILF